MSVFFSLCLILAGEFYRAPVTDFRPLPDTGAVWVYFTDKGIFSETEYETATRTIELAAPTEVRTRRRREQVDGFDFADLPVREEYVQAIEQLGARRRTVSRWLNAASFEMPSELVNELRGMPFVHNVRPVVRERGPVTTRTFPLTTTGETRSQSVDSATAHRFYGPSYDQARMMGVPELYYRGWYGTGVRLAIFDTGIRLDNVGVRDLRIHDQYDFLSGDNLFSAASGDDWRPRQAENMRFLGLAKDPAVVANENQLITAFSADGFDYSASPRRAVFSSISNDRGLTWSSPETLVVGRTAPQLYFNTYENLRLADPGFATYFSYGETFYNSNTGVAGTIWLNYRHNDNWQSPVQLGSGRWSDLLARQDDLLTAWVDNDSLINFRRAAISNAQPSPSWITEHQTIAPEPPGGLAIAAADSNLLIISSARRTGRLYALRSSDLGENWTAAQELTAAAPTGFELTALGSSVILFYKDISQPPFTRLTTLRSDDLGANWHTGTTLTDNTLAVGRIAAAWHDEGIELIYESAGLLYRVQSSDSGRTWQSATIIDSTGFCYQPALAVPHGSDRQTGDEAFAVWFKRGDDNAVWEPADAARFSPDQPNHGTRMASIIAGYSPSGIIGIAPGAELLIARTEFHRTAGGFEYEFDLEEDTYIQALEWAESRGADIISTSLGYRGWYTDEQMDGRTAPVSVAAELAARRGLIIVTAMGNRDQIRRPFGQPYIVAPADARGVVSAGGVQRDGGFWRGTGTGPTADGRCKPELVALSDTVAVVRPDTVSGLEGSAGTSCATALIAGAFALLREAHPDWPADSLKAVMFRTATRTAQSCTFGFGVPRVDEAFRLYPPDKDIDPLPKSGIQAFPNPFIPSEHDQVWFRLELTQPSSRASIRIYTASGALVDSFSLRPGTLGRPGRYADISELEQIGASWDGRNLADKPVAAGLYLAVLHTTYGQAVNRFAVVR